MDNPRSVLLVDDHRLIRAGLRELVDAVKGYEVIAECGSAEDAVAALRKFKPDILIVDVQLPGRTGLSLLEELREISPNTAAIVLSMHDSPDYIADALRKGALSYLLKESAEQDLETALHAVSENRRFLPENLRFSEEPVVSDHDQVPVILGLTARQSEVLYYLARGETIKEVAYRLNISRKTVETHRAAAMAHLGMNTNGDIVRYGVLRGWM